MLVEELTVIVNFGTRRELFKRNIHTYKRH